MKPLVIYHKGCMDGAAAALAAWMRLGDDAEYRPAQYGDPAPTSDEVRGGREVYILDFSYPRDEIERLAHNIFDAAEFDGNYPSQYAGKLVVLDHHHTAQKDLEGFHFCTFDMEKSGAVLAWEHFHPAKEVPSLFQYVQDRDLWHWCLPKSKEVSSALAASEATKDFRALIPILDQVNRIGWSALAREGATILATEQRIVQRIVATAQEVNFHGHVCLAAASAVLQSEVGEALAVESLRRGHWSMGAVYYLDGKLGKYRVSLRSRDHSVEGHHPAPDVSDLAKRHGGGGHARAAGFECAELPWKAAT